MATHSHSTSLRAFLLGILITALLMLPVYLHADAQAVSCPHTTVGGLTVLTAHMPTLRGVTVAKLAAIDAYLRSANTDDGLPHALAFYANSATFNQVLNLGAQHFDWRNFAEFSLPDVGWSWSSCSVDFTSAEHVTLMFMRVQSPASVEFGLMTRVLSIGSGARDGGEFVEGSTSWFEDIGYSAYTRSCAALTADAQTACAAIQAILAG